METTLGPTTFIIIEPRSAPIAGPGGERDRGDFPEKGKAHHLGGGGQGNSPIHSIVPADLNPRPH